MDMVFLYKSLYVEEIYIKILFLSRLMIHAKRSAITVIGWEFFNLLRYYDLKVANADSNRNLNL